MTQFTNRCRGADKVCFRVTLHDVEGRYPGTAFPEITIVHRIRNDPIHASRASRLFTALALSEVCSDITGRRHEMDRRSFLTIGLLAGSNAVTTGDQLGTAEKKACRTCRYWQLTPHLRQPTDSGYLYCGLCCRFPPSVPIEMPVGTVYTPKTVLEIGQCGEWARKEES